MKITLQYGQMKKPRALSVDQGTTLADLTRTCAADAPRPLLAGRVRNKIQDLMYPVQEGDDIVLLDMRDTSARIIYEHSLIMVYLKAIEDVLGRCSTEVRNSLGKGIYTEFADGREITAQQLQQVEEHMHELVDRDIPFRKISVDRAQGMQMLRDADLEEKIHRLNSRPEVNTLTFYELDGFINFFYSFMLPSTSYIYDFKLRKYRRGVIVMYPQDAEMEREPAFIDDRKLYKAFREARDWQVMQGIEYVSDLNEKIEAGEAADIILVSEAQHQKKIVEVTREIMRSRKRVILITGPSSSGKTTFARKLCIQLRVEGVRTLYLGTDDYFVERKDTPRDENGEPNYEGLDAVDIELFNRNIKSLLAGEETDLPVFDFMHGTKQFGRRLTRLASDQLIVIEGIHALNDRLTPEIAEEEKYRIYISPLTPLGIDSHNRILATDMRLLRRTVRDYKYRGHTAEETLLEWPKVRRGENKNVFPYNGKADVFFNSGHLYEISMLRGYAEPLLRAIPGESKAFCEAQRMLHFLAFFRTIETGEAERVVPNDSILREFIGGSVFVD